MDLFRTLARRFDDVGCVHAVLEVNGACLAGGTGTSQMGHKPSAGKNTQIDTIRCDNLEESSNHALLGTDLVPECWSSEERIDMNR